MVADLGALVADLRRLEDAAGDDPARLRGVDAAYKAALADRPYSADLLGMRNRFRVGHADRLPATRPRVVIGGMNDGPFPNFHTVPLLRIADVVSLTTRAEAVRPDRIRYDPFASAFADIVERLPRGFEPDLFFDNQAETHFIPPGIEASPFPTAASFCHHTRPHQIEALADLFDYVLPLSPGFSDILRRRGTKGQVVDLPFGLNWGSFHHLVAPAREKTVDLAIAFGSGLHPVSLGHRHAVYARMQRLAARDAGRHAIVFAEGLDKKSYLELLARSRIVLNVVGVHGPYNYRLCEAAAAGAMVIQYHYDGPVRCDIRDYLRDGEEIVVATDATLESTVEHYLEAHEASAAIAARGAWAIRRRYSYEAGYSALIRRVRRDRAKGCAIAQGKPGGLMARARLGRAYLEREEEAAHPYAAHAVAAALQAPPAQSANDLMVLAPVLVRAGLGKGLAKALQGIVDLSQGVQSLPEAVEKLAARSGPNPMALWNRAMLHASWNRATPAMAHTALDAIRAAADFSAWDGWLVAIYARPPYLTHDEWKDSRLRLRAFPHLAARGDRAKELAAGRDWMMWHMHRLLAEAAAGGMEGRLARDRLLA